MCFQSTLQNKNNVLTSCKVLGKIPLKYHEISQKAIQLLVFSTVYRQVDSINVQNMVRQGEDLYRLTL